MHAKLLKNFTTYINRGDMRVNEDVLETLGNWDAVDPIPSAWNSKGFVPVDGSSYFVDISGRGFLACVQINDKILPGSVLREKITERAAQIEDRNGRKIGKKEYAELKEEVALELLPQAFLRRKLIPVIFSQDRVFVFTSSAKAADSVMMSVMRAFEDAEGYDSARDFQLALFSNILKSSISGALTALAKTGEEELSSENKLSVGDTVTLKGKDKETIAVREVDVAGHDVGALLKQDYKVAKLEIELWCKGSDEADCTFTVNDSLVVNRLAMRDIASGEEGDAEQRAKDLVGSAWMVTDYAHHIVDDLAELCGGFTAKPVKVKRNAADIEDEEL